MSLTERQTKAWDRSKMPEGLEHWESNDWEAKARENPFFAIQSEVDWMDGPNEGFTPEQTQALFDRGRVIYAKYLYPLIKRLDDPFVVEYGCGAGRVLRALVDAGARCGGVDISPTMIEHCRRLVPEATVGTLAEPLPTDCADVVFSHAVLQHIDSLSAYLAAVDECCRMLKPNGLLALHVACEDFCSGADGEMGRTENFEDRSLHYRPGEAKPYLEHPQTTWSGVYIGRQLLEQRLAAAGVTVERWRPHNPKKPRAVWVIGRKARSAELRPGLEFEFRIQATLGEPIEQGTWEERRRRIVPILGGTVKGARFKGVVLAGGADWQTIRLSDGAAQISGRFTLQHEDGTVVGVINPGVRPAPPEVAAGLAAGETDERSIFYFRAAPQFEVPPGPHQWLAENIFVCVAKGWPGAVKIDVYRVI